MKKEHPEIIEVDRETAGKFHSWVRAKIKKTGKIIIIRKPNNEIQRV